MQTNHSGLPAENYCAEVRQTSTAIRSTRSIVCSYNVCYACVCARERVDSSDLESLYTKLFPQLLIGMRVAVLTHARGSRLRETSASPFDLLHYVVDVVLETYCEDVAGAVLQLNETDGKRTHSSSSVSPFEASTVASSASATAGNPFLIHFNAFAESIFELAATIQSVQRMIPVSESTPQRTAELLQVSLPELRGQMNGILQHANEIVFPREPTPDGLVAASYSQPGRFAADSSSSVTEPIHENKPEHASSDSVSLVDKLYTDYQASHSVPLGHWMSIVGDRVYSHPTYIEARASYLAVFPLPIDEKADDEQEPCSRPSRPRFLCRQLCESNAVMFNAAIGAGQKATVTAMIRNSEKPGRLPLLVKFMIDTGSDMSYVDGNLLLSVRPSSGVDSMSQSRASESGLFHRTPHCSIDQVSTAGDSRIGVMFNALITIDGLCKDLPLTVGYLRGFLNRQERRESDQDPPILSTIPGPTLLTAVLGLNFLDHCRTVWTNRTSVHLSLISNKYAMPDSIASAPSASSVASSGSLSSAALPLQAAIEAASSSSSQSPSPPVFHVPSDATASVPRETTFVR